MNHVLETLFFALIPILITIGLGYYSAVKGTFDEQDSHKLARLVLNYMLPLNVFAGIWGTSRKIMIQDVGLALWLAVAMVVCFLLMILVYRYALKNDAPVAILRAMSIADPSVPFVGSAVLPLIFGANDSAITIGICTLTINVIMLPIAFSAFGDNGDTVSARLKNTFKKPLVIAALLGFILVLCGSQMPTQFDSIFTLLGKGAGGLAIFTTGIVLKTRQITFNKTICSTILLKNLAFPLVVWGCMALFNSPTPLTRLVVVALAIPTATMPSTLAIRFNVHEAELALTQFWSTALSFITLTAFVLALS